MRRIGSLVTAILLAACGTGPTDSGDELPPGPLAIAIVQGDSQSVSPTDTLPKDAVVRISKGGEPLNGQLVDWEIVEDGCGDTFIATTETDENGQSGNRVVAGRKAWTHFDLHGPCHMEVRSSLSGPNAGQAVVDTTFEYLVFPGAYADDRVGNNETLGPALDTMFVGVQWRDQYDNFIAPRAWEVGSRDTSIISTADPAPLAAQREEYWNAARLVARDTGTVRVDVTVGDSINPWYLHTEVTRDSVDHLDDQGFGFRIDVTFKASCSSVDWGENVC